MRCLPRPTEMLLLMTMARYDSWDLRALYTPSLSTRNEVGLLFFDKFRPHPEDREVILCEREQLMAGQTGGNVEYGSMLEQ